MDIINNQGEKIGSLTNAISSDHSITINRIHDVTIVSTRDRNTGGGDDGDLHRRFALRQIGDARLGGLGRFLPEPPVVAESGDPH